MRTTLNISGDLIKEAEAIYQTGNRSKAVENALRDAIKMKKLEAFKQLKGKIQFDTNSVDKLRSLENDEK
ncbi:MAG: DUF2191 domain-containing protein [Ruminiclostridium sp.]|nr:DUF2191 domain-containing protein [Ruminiclostridium sp.]